MNVFVRALHGESSTGLAVTRDSAGDIACLYESKSRKYCLGGRRRTRPATVEEAVDGMLQALPIDRLGEMRREAGRFGRGHVTVRSETAESNSTQLAGITQFAHQLQAAAIG